MNYFHVKAIRETDSTAKVLWSTGETTYGAIQVEAGTDPEDICTVAELAVIRYLVTEKQVLGNPVYSGKGISLTVSKGAVKKLAQGRSSKVHLRPFSAFFNARLKGCEILVAKKNPYLPADDAPVAETIQAERQYHETISTPVLGVVGITDHAMERYAQYVPEIRTDRVFKSLSERLQNPYLSAVQLPAHVLKHKASKYGPDDQTTTWRHPTDNLHFVTFRLRDGSWILLTVFPRSDPAPLLAIDEAKDLVGEG